MDTSDYLTMFSILTGPAFAVWLTRFLDNRRERYSRRMDIFRTLMRTRRTPIYSEHVGALNLIEIEFSKDKEVIKFWKELFEHFATEHQKLKSEKVEDSLSEEDITRRNNDFHDRLSKERQTILAKLLHAMAKAMDFKTEQLEIFEGGYTPQGWNDVETEQSIIRKFFVELYLGKRVLPVGVVDYVSPHISAGTDANDNTDEIREVAIT